MEVEAKEEVEVIGGGGAAGKGKRYCRWCGVRKGWPAASLECYYKVNKTNGILNT